MTSGTELTLVKVLHVLNIRKNLVSGSLLVKNKFKLVFESYKFVLIKNDQFLSKCYVAKDIVKMKVICVKYF